MGKPGEEPAIGPLSRSCSTSRCHRAEIQGVDIGESGTPLAKVRPNRGRIDDGSACILDAERCARLSARSHEIRPLRRSGRIPYLVDADKGRSRFYPWLAGVPTSEPELFSNHDDRGDAYDRGNDKTTTRISDRMSIHGLSS